MPDIIITGIPRCGTTLASALVDSLPDAVCLNEPDWHTGKRASSADDFAKWLVGDFVKTRKKLLAGEAVPDRRSFEGKALTNYFKANPATRQMETHYQVMPFIRAGLSPDFTLAIKHNGPYLAALKPIVDIGFFPSIIALVRHPVRAIYSWRTLDLPISRGEMPNALYYWPRMAELTRQECGLLEKQVKMYDMMCARIHSQRDRIHVLPYETLIAHPETLLEYVGIQAAIDPGIIRRDLPPIPEAERKEIAAAVQAHGEYYKYFYPDLETKEI